VALRICEYRAMKCWEGEELRGGAEVKGESRRCRSNRTVFVARLKTNRIVAFCQSGSLATVCVLRGEISEVKGSQPRVASGSCHHNADLTMNKRVSDLRKYQTLLSVFDKRPI
jgi:hypothetical protein